jgi:hypothetical protein
LPEPSVISDYLDELAAALRLSRRRRARVLAESKEHLIDAARHALASDADPVDAQRSAVERFGPVPVVAAAFHRQAAAATLRSSVVALAAAALLTVVAQATGSPLFWYVGRGGLAPTGPWPAWAKDGVVLASDLRAVADLVAVLGLAWAFVARAQARAVWIAGLAGLAAAGAIGVSALAGLAELLGATGFGPVGVRAAAVGALLAATAVMAGGTVLHAVWRLWAVRSGWVPFAWPAWQVAGPAWQAGPRTKAQRVLRRALLVAVPAAAAFTLAASALETIGQGNLRSGANVPQIQVAQQAARLLAQGAPPGSVAKGPIVNLGTSLGVHLSVFDENGRVLASTAVLDGRTPVPPAGVLRTARARDDLVTWQPRPDVRVAAVATRWSGPAGRGTIVVGRSLKVVEQREGRLLRRIALWWLLAMVTTAIVALITAFWPERRAGDRRGVPTGGPSLGWRV